MSQDPAIWFGLLARAHGICALLGSILGLHLAFWLSRGAAAPKRNRRIALLATLLQTGGALGGALLYPTYRSGVKPTLIQEAIWFAALFEAKEHLAFAACLFALGGTAALYSSHPAARPAAARLLAIGGGLGVLVTLLGITVAAVAQPGWRES